MKGKEELETMGIISNDKEKEEKYNTIADIIKWIAVISAIVGIITGIITMKSLEGRSVVIIIVSIISAVFVYALGEIIQKLQNIENNTKNWR